MRGCGFGQRVALVHVDLELSRCDRRHGLASQLQELIPRLNVVEQGGTLQVEALWRQIKWTDRFEGAACIPKGDEVSPFGQAVQGGLPHVLPDTIVDDIHTPTAGDALHLGDEMLGLGADDDVRCAILVGDLRLGLGGDGADDGGSNSTGQLAD